MKISPINQNKCNTVKISQSKPPFATNTSSPINFKSRDSFEFNKLGLGSLYVDTSHIPDNINLTLIGRKYDKKFVGTLNDTHFVFHQKANEYSGKQDSKFFNFKSKNSLFLAKNKGFEGTFGGKQFIIKSTNIDKNVFMIGNLGDESIKIEGVDDTYNSTLKGYIGHEFLEMTVSFTEIGTFVEGRINGKEFGFKSDQEGLSGGTTSNSELFPIILALTTRRDNFLEKEQIQEKRQEESPPFESEYWLP